MARNITQKKTPEIEKLIFEKIKLQQTISGLKEAIDSLEDDIEVKKNENKSMDKSISLKSEKLKDLHSEINKENIRIKGLEEQRLIATNTFNKLKEELKSLENDARSLRDNIKSYSNKEKELKDIKLSLADMKKEIMVKEIELEYIQNKKKVFLNYIQASEISYNKASEDYDNAMISKRKAEKLLNGALKKIEKDISNKIEENKNLDIRLGEKKSSMEIEIKELQLKAYKLEDEALIFKKKRDTLKVEVEKEKKKYLKYKEQLI